MKITAEMIEKRLAGQPSQPRVSNGYDEPVGYDEPEAEEEKEEGGVLFYASIAATFLGIGAAVFFWDGSLSFLKWKLPGSAGSSYVSEVDPICKPLWKAMAFNDDALACYMIEKPRRFCKPEERAHLVAKFAQFRLDIELAKGKAIRDITINQKETFAKIEKEIANFDHPQAQYSPSQTKKPVAVRKYLKPAGSFQDQLADFQRKAFNPALRNQNLELSGILRGLLEKGYFETWEFGIVRDKIVSDALEKPLPPVKSPCAKAGDPA